MNDLFFWENEKARIYMGEIFFVNAMLWSTLVALVELKINLLGALFKRPYFGVKYSFSKGFFIELRAEAICGKG